MQNKFSYMLNKFLQWKVIHQSKAQAWKKVPRWNLPNSSMSNRHY